MDQLTKSLNSDLIGNFNGLPDVLPVRRTLKKMKSFSIPVLFKSNLIGKIKEARRFGDKMKKNFEPSHFDFGPIEILISRHFGFCYGVENAVETAYRIVEENPDKRIFLLSEMIHNPAVNADLLDRGVEFIQDTLGNQLVAWDQLTSDDVVIVPAFGTTLEIQEILSNIGIDIYSYDTTCPFVEKVWNRSEQIAQKGYSIVVHGKPKHEETRATFSHASYHTPTVVVNDMEETIALAKYITGEKEADLFYKEFEGRYSANFDITKDLEKIGVVNQTTQLASDTQAISEYLKATIKAHYELTDDTIATRFADTRDTLCYATSDNQTAVKGMLDTDADLAIVIGGYNSSNSSHLVELCEQKLPTYFIDSPDRLLSKTSIEHRNWNTKELHTLNNYLPEQAPVKILITSGASCPDAVVEAVIQKIASFYNVQNQVDFANVVKNE